LKKILIEVNEDGNSFITYYRREDTSIYNYHMYNLSQLSFIEKKYQDEGTRITKVTVKN